MTQTPRPLSPHLQVYRPQLTSVMSILHRMTGVALAVGSLMVVWWLVSAAYGEEAYNVARLFAASNIGTLMIFGWSVALFYHLCNGVRHLFWDSGRLFNIRQAYAAGYLVLLMTAVLTVGAWVCADRFSISAGLYPPAVGDTLAESQVEGDQAP